MQRSLPLLLFLLFAVFGILFLLPERSGEDATNRGEEAARQAPAEVDAAPTLEAGPAEAAADIARLERESDVASHLGLEVLPAPEFEGPGLELLVLQYGTDVPVAEALVLLGEEGWRPTPEGDLAARLGAGGLAYSTDEGGRLRFPLDWVGRWVGVQADGLWGSAPIDRPDHGEVVRVRVAPDRNVQVTVLDHEDRPLADVPVGLFGSPFGGIKLQKQAVTDGRGVAWIRMAGDPILRDWGTHQFWVDTVAPKPDPPHETYPLAELPQRVLLRVDRPATLEVHLKDLDGEPMPRPVAVNLVRPGPDGKASGRKDPSIRAQGECEVPGGRIVFRGLEHGMPLLVEAHFLADGPSEAHPVDPLGPGEHRVVEVRQAEGQPELTMRLVDERQQPLVDVAVESFLYVVLPGYPEMPTRSPHRTDSEGRILRSLPEGSIEVDGFRIEGRRLELLHEDPVSGSVRTATVDLLRPFPTGPHDLGDVVMETQPVLAAGSVVDEHGSPMADVGVRMELAEVTDRGGFISTGTPRRVGREQTTDAEGRFIFHGKPRDGEYTLTARGRGGTEASVQMQVGDVGHHIVLEKGHILAGHVRLPEELQGKRASVLFFRPTELDPDALDWERDVTDRYGNFQLGGLDTTPGLVAVTLGRSYPTEHLLEYEGVVPWVPGTEGDPRLLEIDLRDAFRSFHVRAVDTSGTSLPDAQFIQFKKTKIGSSWSTSESLDGSYTYHAIEASLKVTVKAPGFHPREVELVEPETEVELTRAQKGVFLVDRMPELGDNQSLILDLDPIGFDIGGFRLEPDVFDASGRLETFLPPPGRYHVNLGLRTSSPGGWTSTDEPLLDPSGNRVEVLIDERGEAPTFRMEVPEGLYGRLPGLR